MQTKTGRSVMEHQFAEVPRAEIPRSSFDRSSALKTAHDADYLIPIYLDDIIPGDTVNLDCTFFARLATPLHPILDNLYYDTFWFFVPYRLVWDNFEKMHGSQVDPGDSISVSTPVISSSTAATGHTVNSIYDYFGMPTIGQVATIDLTEFQAMPFRAYNLIWNEWFRDQNLQDSKVVSTGNGPDSTGSYGLWKRGKRHDYFTSALPFPQKGDAVDLPLGVSAAVYTSTTNQVTGAQAPLQFLTDSGGAPLQNMTLGTGASAGSNNDKLGYDAVAGFAHDDMLYPSNLYADLSTATTATINDLRLAMQTQRLLERDARSGTRYVEMLKAHFGVTSPDQRLQRPEYLGGGSSPINMNVVPQTSRPGTPATDDQVGDLGAFGTVSGTHGFTKSFVEHGMLIGLASVRADQTYSQGAERFWYKRTRYDFYYPVLSQIGEQSILNREIYYTNTATDENVFGYTERYNEYRYKPSRLSSIMRPTAASTLASWHLSEKFNTLPALGDTFIQSNAGSPLDRAITVNTEPHFLVDMWFNCIHARPMPLYGVPGNLDHF